MNRILIIQTAFTGDVILATPIIESLRKEYPNVRIDFALRKGNEALFGSHPIVERVLIWDKRSNKILNLIKLIRTIRAMKYDLVINCQRFFSSGIIVALSGAEKTIGFKKNPLSFLFTDRVEHVIGNNLHEVDRNLMLLKPIVKSIVRNPKLYPSENDYNCAKRNTPYICIAPGSVWFTKQWPSAKWVELINKIPDKYEVILIGGKNERSLCEVIAKKSGKNITILAGELSFLQSAALIKNAAMNYVNDSAPLHICSAMNASVTAIYCSTVPEFGFYPLSSHGKIIQKYPSPTCKPCGLHGKSKCPLGHFSCAEINIREVVAGIL